MADRLVLLSIPQLRRQDVAPGGLASLEKLARRGTLTDLIPPFPGLSASSFATLITGVGPGDHGIIGNSYFDREQRKIMTAPLPDSAVQAPRIWDRLRAKRPGARTMLWFAPNCRGAEVELAAWIDDPWCLMTRPEALGPSLEAKLGPLPCPRPAVEPPRLEATTWMLQSAAATIAAEKPDLAIVRIPYLGQVARRYGPDGREAGRSVRELETCLAPFLANLAPGTEVVAATESVTTPVTGPIRPNLVLRELGLLATTPSPAGGLDVDIERSAAFALVDHQLCHIYLNDPAQAAAIAAAFAGDDSDGIARVVAHNQRSIIGLDHPRSGDVILVASPDHWFAPDWWAHAKERPAKDASRLIRATPSGLLDPKQVHGSLGAPPPGRDYLGVLVCSSPTKDGPRLAAREVTDLLLSLLGD